METEIMKYFEFFFKKIYIFYQVESVVVTFKMITEIIEQILKIFTGLGDSVIRSFENWLGFH